jgi:FSR family fosmidomycin resistance protein-like MFS transporter
MPVLYVSKGYSLVSAGLVYSLFTLAGAISGVLSGYLSDRIGFKPVFLTSYILMPPALILLLFLPGNWIYPGAILAGFFALATLPLGVVMAQKLAPRGRSMVASLMMGLAYGLGGMLSPMIGKLADLYSIQPVLFCVALIPLLSLLLIFRFPEIKKP